MARQHAESSKTIKKVLVDCLHRKFVFCMQFFCDIWFSLIKQSSCVCWIISAFVIHFLIIILLC